MPSRSYIWKMRFEMDNGASFEASKTQNDESKPQQRDAKKAQGKNENPDQKKTAMKKVNNDQMNKPDQKKARQKKCHICKKPFPDCDLNKHWLGPHAKPQTVRYCMNCEAN